MRAWADEANIEGGKHINGEVIGKHESTLI